MAVTPYEVIAGPAQVWTAPTGTAFPVINAAPAAAWVPVGRTEGGVTVRHNQDVEVLRADNSSGPIKAIRTEETLEVEFEFVDLTLENFARALQATVVTAVGPPATKTINLRQGFDVVMVALLIRGPSPYGNFNMQYQLPLAAQTESPEVSFTRDDKATLGVQFTIIEDLTAATEAERFGKLIAQTA